MSVRYIAAPSLPDDPVTRAKQHWLGKLYIRHLKRYSAFRVLVNYGWTIVFPRYRWLQQRLVRPTDATTPLALVTQSEFVSTHGLKRTILVDSHDVVTPTPKVYPAREQDYLKSPHDSYTFPETFVAQFPDAVVHGGTNIVVAMGYAVYHDLVNWADDFTSEELNGRMRVDVGTGTLVWAVADPDPEYLEIAANFVDACASNYAHWMTEVAPRIALFCRRPEFDGVPLIVNDGLHPNIMESLAAFSMGKHPIILLPTGRSVKVSQLLVVSCAGYVPFEPRGEPAKLSHGKFNSVAFELMRHICSTPLQSEPPARMIYLRRNSGVRRLTNSQAIEALLVRRGFAVVEPEKLSFAEQVHIFREAEVIIGPTGAALANIIFSETRAHIAVLISQQEDIIYWYWQNIARASGKSVSYVFGNNVDIFKWNVHADFEVSLDSVIEFVKDLGIPSAIDDFQIHSTTIIHPTAIIHPEAVIGDGVCVAPYAVIGKAVVGRNTNIHAHVVIADGVHIGDGVEIFPGAFIGKEPKGAGALARTPEFERFVEIGSNSSIGPHAIIYYDVCIGRNTLIGDGASIREQCRIGNFCIISRYVTLNYNAHVGDRTKIMDNTHITGNCRIGSDVFISINVGTTNDNVIRGGFADHIAAPIIEDGATLAVGVSVLPGVTVGANSMVGAGALVTRDVEAGTTVMGIPAKPKLAVPKVISGK